MNPIKQIKPVFPIFETKEDSKKLIYSLIVNDGDENDPGMDATIQQLKKNRLLKEWASTSDKTKKIREALWKRLTLIFKNIFKDLNTLNLSTSQTHLRKMVLNLNSLDPVIRRLTLLIVLTRLKFSKKFRKNWIKLFPILHYSRQILIGSSWSNFLDWDKILASRSNQYSQATIFFSQDLNGHTINFDEFELGKAIVTQDLTSIPDPATSFSWLDRDLRKEFKDRALKGQKYSQEDGSKNFCSLKPILEGQFISQKQVRVPSSLKKSFQIRSKRTIRVEKKKEIKNQKISELNYSQNPSLFSKINEFKIFRSSLHSNLDRSPSTSPNHVKERINNYEEEEEKKQDRAEFGIKKIEYKKPPFDDNKLSLFLPHSSKESKNYSIKLPNKQSTTKKLKISNRNRNNSTNIQRERVTSMSINKNQNKRSKSNQRSFKISTKNKTGNAERLYAGFNKHHDSNIFKTTITNATVENQKSWKFISKPRIQKMDKPYKKYMAAETTDSPSSQKNKHFFMVKEKNRNRSTIKNRMKTGSINNQNLTKKSQNRPNREIKEKRENRIESIERFQRSYQNYRNFSGQSESGSLTINL